MVRNPRSGATPAISRRRLVGSASFAALLAATGARADRPAPDRSPLDRLPLDRSRDGSGPDGAVLARGLRRARLPLPPTPPPEVPRLAAKPPPRLIMLDPGHGGKDPGAIGVSGTYEKHIALAAAQELRRQLETGGQYRVEMTRHADLFIPLEDRVAIAQSRGAALFLSIHADALADHEVRGASVYTLGADASDAQTAALARRENSADRFAAASLRNTSPELARILASLAQQETRLSSARLARDMVDALDQDLPMLPNPSRHAGFVVLKSGDIPSVLVEMGFMSNPTDERALCQASHRATVARAMKRAVDAYLASPDHASSLG